MITLKNQAIETALVGDWRAAITLNRQLLQDNPEDVETMNRLAFAYAVIGKTKDAKEMYQRVLALDDQNPIALKNLKRLTGTNSKNIGATSPALAKQVDSMFLEESGKTKVIELVNVAEPKVIAHLMVGQPLDLRIKRLKIFVLDDKQYVGMLPDDIGKRLIKFLNGGNDYEACVKAVESRKITIFVKETKRSARFKNQASFTSTDKSKPIQAKFPVRVVDDEDQAEEESR